MRALVEQHAADVVLVLGSPNSSNSNRLREVAEAAGREPTCSGPRPSWTWPGWMARSAWGVTAGASTPEHLVSALVERLRELGATDVETVETRHRRRVLRATADASVIGTLSVQDR